MNRLLSYFCLLLIGSCCLSCRSALSPGSTTITRSQTSPASLPEMLQRAKAAGLPITLAEMQAPLPPPERNAAPLYRQLTALLKTEPLVGDDKAAMDAVSYKPLTASQAKRLRNALRHRADIGRLVQEGNTFVVYSVGKTGQFDGGTTAVKPKASESLFRYPLPTYLK